jgi:hypothetical protein
MGIYRQTKNTRKILFDNYAPIIVFPLRGEGCEQPRGLLPHYEAPVRGI